MLNVIDGVAVEADFLAEDLRELPVHDWLEISDRHQHHRLKPETAINFPSAGEPAVGHQANYAKVMQKRLQKY
ncbi:hypothetical protein [Mesorhizobium sp.]|uniref:hypothetical protein n=1 Tax=Mesorhizobium sp. TaxID=1871066 RepID=UPI0025D09FD9|nr:hypothetical protein [Mesorhizobium sp.]